LAGSEEHIGVDDEDEAGWTVDIEGNELIFSV